MDRENFAADGAKNTDALRSQLSQMAAASQMLERSTESEKGRAYLAIMNQGICRMLRIVGRMELGHRLSGEVPLRFTPKYMDLVPRLEGLCQRLESILTDIGITFTLRCPDRLPATVDGDLLQQMLLELVSSLALVGTELTLTAAQKDGKLYFHLGDQGPDQAEGRPVLPASLEDQEEKSGIELARRIAELHGGNLVISTNADRLSVAVSIPLVEGAAGQLESPRAPWHSGGFDPVLVAMSGLLPSRSFLPETLG